jgi:type IV pilus assembly protein PilP
MKQRIPASEAFAWSVCLALALCLAAISPASAQAPPPQPAAPAPPVPEEYSYRGMGRRDPFKSLLALQEKKRDISLLPPIQQVELSSFKVVGIIVDPTSGNRAMVKAPDGKSYVVKKGDIMGKNDGEVAEIGMAGLTVRERYLDFMGKETVVSTVLKVTDKLK